MKPLTTREVMREHDRAGTDVLDGFRGIAILLVMVFHTWLFSWYTPDVRVLGIGVPLDVFARTGYLGVELFFFISAFVLFYPIVERHANGLPQTELPTFAYRRFLKIAPSYSIALAATVWSVRSLHLHVPIAPTLAQHVLLVQNFFSDDFGQANSVFWSLAIEVQFYLVFPMLAWAFVRRPALVALAMIATALGYRYGVSHCCLQVETVNRQIPAFFDVFACGMFCAYAVSRAHARGEARIARLRPAFTLVAIAAALVAFALLRSANGIQYDIGGREKWILANRTSIALTVGVLVFASAMGLRAWRRLIANPVTIFLSLVSYNLYLWHTLVMIWLWKHHAIASATPNPHDDDHWKFAFIVTGWSASLAISTAITYFVERPLLATHKPHNFAFDWSRLRPKPQAISSSETRT